MPKPYPKRRQAADVNRAYGVRSGEAPRDAGDLATANSVSNTQITAAAASVVKANSYSSFDFWSGGSYGPGGSGKATANTRVFDLEVSLGPTEYRDGDTVVLFHDYDLIVLGGCFDWASLVEEVYRYGQSVSTPAAGASSSGKTQLLRSRNWVQGATAARIHAPGAATSGGLEIPVLRAGIFQDTLPADTDGDYDSTGYNYLFRIRSVGSALLTGSNPYENAKDTGGETFRADDVNLVGMVIRETG